MKARIDDRIVVEGTHLGQPRRVGVILEVHGEEGAPPYLVEWQDNGHRTLLFPGPDARLEPRIRVA